MVSNYLNFKKVYFEFTLTSLVNPGNYDSTVILKSSFLLQRNLEASGNIFLFFNHFLFQWNINSSLLYPVISQ